MDRNVLPTSNQCKDTSALHRLHSIRHRSALAAHCGIPFHVAMPRGFLKNTSKRTGRKKQRGGSSRRGGGRNRTESPPPKHRRTRAGFNKGHPAACPFCRPQIHKRALNTACTRRLVRRWAKQLRMEAPGASASATLRRLATNQSAGRATRGAA